MGKLTEWLDKNATLKEGVNKAEFEELERKSTFEGITTKEQAADFIKKNAAFTAALDVAVTEAVKSHDENFTKEKLPKLIKAEREKIEQELNPEMTEDQKELKRLRDKDIERDRLDLLRRKAKELEVSDDDIDDYLVYGEQAVEVFERRTIAQKENFTTAVNKAVEVEIDKRYKGQKPPQSSTTTPDKLMKRTDFDQLNPQGKSDFIKDGGVVED